MGEEGTRVRRRSVGAATDSSERAELERLRAENVELQMQVEFAEKVATWFEKGKQ